MFEFLLLTITGLHAADHGKISEFGILGLTIPELFPRSLESSVSPIVTSRYEITTKEKKINNTSAAQYTEKPEPATQ